jgi:hypothetical protein
MRRFWSLRSLIDGLCRSWTNTSIGTSARLDPSLERTSAATLLFPRYP